MKDRDASAALAAGLCLSVALLRMFAPTLPFDWMTLLLVLAAVVALLLPACLPRRDARGCMPAAPVTTAASPSPADDAETLPNQPETPTDGSEAAADNRAAPSRDAAEAIARRVELAGWEAGKQGLFDALNTLRADEPFAALCVARGTLLMMTRRMQLSGEDQTTIALLSAALDDTARAGASHADEQAVDALFDLTLRTLGFLETQATRSIDL